MKGVYTSVGNGDEDKSIWEAFIPGFNSWLHLLYSQTSVNSCRRLTVLVKRMSTLPRDGFLRSQ